MEKLSYTINIAIAYSYIGDLIDALKKADQTVANVKNKIERVEMRERSGQGERESNAFAAKKRGCFICGEAGHFARVSKCPSGKQ